eukprot:scaffold4679_cov81-Skeletonema_dohrnii-CCMP3373.AAC.1
MNDKDINASPTTQKHRAKTMKEQPTNYTGGPSLEQRFRQYLSAFDGKNKDFSKVEHLFDALFHKDFFETTNNSQQQQTVSRDQTKAMHAMYFAMGTRATLIHYRKIGLHTIDISYHLCNDQVDIVVRQLSSRMQNSIVRTQQVSCRKVALDNDGKHTINETECSAFSYMKARVSVEYRRRCCCKIILICIILVKGWNDRFR